MNRQLLESGLTRKTSENNNYCRFLYKDKGLIFFNAECVLLIYILHKENF